MHELTHCSYLLRLWRERGEAPWRITLIAVAQPDERHHFDTLEACIAFVCEQAGVATGRVEPSNRLDGSTSIVSHMEAAEK